MGLGIFLVWPLAKRFGKRNVTLAGFAISAIGGFICCLQPHNMVVVLIGQFIKNIGRLPCAYVFMALFADTLDHLEWKSGIRCDGLAMSIYNIIAVASVGICTGIFNMLLAEAGYAAPTLDAAGNTIAAIQSESVQSLITFAFVGLEVITGLVLVVVLAFLNIEKTLVLKQQIIRRYKSMEETEEQKEEAEKTYASLSAKQKAAWEKEIVAGEKYRSRIAKELGA